MLKVVIHHDQMGFVPAMNVIRRINRMKTVKWSFQ